MSFKVIDPIWSLHDHYTVHQAAALIANVDPMSLDGSGDYFRNPETNRVDREGIARVKTAFSLLVNSIKAKSLQALVRYPAELRYIAGQDMYMERGCWQGEDVTTCEAVDPHAGKEESFVVHATPDWHETLIRRSDLIAWLSHRGFRSGFFFPEAADEPDYLNPDYPRYSAKLAAAVKVWMAMEDENLWAGQSPQNAMKGWLENHYQELGLILIESTSKPGGSPIIKRNTNGIGDVAKVANWNTSGGAPKTPSND